MRSDDRTSGAPLDEERTRLANERTLLAYQRTALGFAVAGVTLIHVFHEVLIQLSGWLLIVMGAGIAIIGVYRYLRVRLMLRSPSDRDT
jgi:putative membrane protein